MAESEWTEDDIYQAMSAAHGIKREAARLLGWPESTFRRRLKKCETRAFLPGNETERTSFVDTPKKYNTGGGIDGVDINKIWAVEMRDCRLPDDLLPSMPQKEGTFCDNRPVLKQTVHERDGEVVQRWTKYAAPQAAATDVAQLIREAMDGYQPEHVPQIYPCPSPQPTLLELALTDAHFGKACWHKEADDDYDLKIAQEVYLTAVKDLVHRPSTKPSEILFLVGSDLFHSDSPKGVTPIHGINLDMDGRWTHIFKAAFRTVVASIDYCASIAPVNVMVIPGNHDLQSPFYLGHSLEVYYDASQNVYINNSPKSRKYYRFGKTLFGYTHGHDERHGDLPLIMATEAPYDWAEAQWRMWRLGHFHKAKQTQFTAGNAEMGVTVEVMPSLCGTDEWHARKGYIQPIKQSRAYLHHSFDGPIAAYFHHRDLRAA